MKLKGSLNNNKNINLFLLGKMEYRVQLSQKANNKTC